jgi:hypothetical protein
VSSPSPHARRLPLAATALAAVAVGAAGCGSDGSSSEGATTSTQPASAAWADGLCGALSKWQSSLRSVRSTLKNRDELSKAKLQEESAAVADANKQLSSDVDALGAPPRSAGPEAKAAVNELSSDLRTSADQIRGSTESISGAKDVVEAVHVSSAALLTMSADVSKTVDTLQSLDAAEAWRQAFADSDACKSLRKS